MAKGQQNAEQSDSEIEGEGAARGTRSTRNGAAVDATVPDAPGPGKKAAAKAKEKAGGPSTGHGTDIADESAQGDTAVKSPATAATQGLKSAGESTVAAGQHVASKAKAGGRRVAAAPAAATAAASATWTVLKARKLIAGGVGVGLAALVGASYAAGNRASRRNRGPFTRLTHGRL